MSALHCWYCCQDHRPESCPNRTEAEKKADVMSPMAKASATGADLEPPF